MPTSPSRELQTFQNPKPDRPYEIAMECPEFTCVCPMTGQPDFATIRLRYVPDAVRGAEEPQALPVELPRRGHVPRGGDQPDLRRPRPRARPPLDRGRRRLRDPRRHPHHRDGAPRRAPGRACSRAAPGFRSLPPHRSFSPWEGGDSRDGRLSNRVRPLRRAERRDAHRSRGRSPPADTTSGWSRRRAISSRATR